MADKQVRIEALKTLESTDDVKTIVITTDNKLALIDQSKYREPLDAALAEAEAARDKAVAQEKDIADAIVQGRQAVSDAQEAKAIVESVVSVAKQQIASTISKAESDILANIEKNDRAETLRVASEEARAESEASRVNAENERNEAEQSRISTELLRSGQEQARQQDETARQSGEQARQSAETFRASQEAERESSEAQRKASESSRDLAESARVAAEQVREQAETKRESDAAKALSDAVSALSTAQTATESAVAAAGNAMEAAGNADAAVEANNIAVAKVIADAETSVSEMNPLQELVLAGAMNAMMSNILVSYAGFFALYSDEPFTYKLGQTEYNAARGWTYVAAPRNANLAIPDEAKTKIKKVVSMSNWGPGFELGSGAALEEVYVCIREGLAYSFSKCYNLKRVVLTGTASSKLFHCFRYTRNLEYMDVRYLDVSKCSSFDGFLMGAANPNLKEIRGVERWVTDNATSMGSMFSGCSGLTELNVSNFNTEQVTNMGGMFSGCSGLTELNVSNFNTEQVTNMGSMFSGCSSLQTLNCGVLDFTNTTNAQWVFANCNMLATITGEWTGLKQNLALNYSPLTRDSAIVVIGGLYDFAHDVGYDANVRHTIQFSNTTKNLLSDEDIQVATDKGWTIA